MPQHDISAHTENGLGVITFESATNNNAYRPQTMAELCSALDAFQAEDAVKAIILRASGKHFCAGADLTFLESLPEQPPASIKRDVYTYFQGAARRIYHCEKPTLALLTGSVLTVGCELALACDFRIAADNVRLQESWVKIGLLPPLGGLFLLPRIIGLGQAKEMMLRGVSIDAPRALSLGLVSEVVPKDELWARGDEFAKELAAAPPLAYAAIKRSLHRAMSSSIEAEWSANLPDQAILLSTSDFQEGLDAAKSKRTPHFNGA